MTKTWRFTVTLTVAMLISIWSGPDTYAQEKAKRRDRDGEYTKTEPRRDAPPPRARQPREAQPDAQRHHPQPTNDGRNDRNNSGERARERSRDHNPQTEAQRRHPRPDGRYDRDRSDGRRDYNRYDWRKYNGRSRWDRDRFPRSYSGIRLFDRMYYRGRPFGPHYRLWYFDRHAWRLFYWPYPFAPAYQCGWYFVPTARYPVYDPYDPYSEVYWEYTDYQYIYLCFD